MNIIAKCPERELEICYSGDRPPIGHTFLIDDIRYVVVSTTSTLHSPTRRSGLWEEGHINVEVKPV